MYNHSMTNTAVPQSKPRQSGAKKIILALLSFTLLLSSSLALSTPSPTRAAIPLGTWYNPTYKQFVDKIGDSTPENEMFGERYTYAQVTWILHSLVANASFGDPATLEAIKQLGLRPANNPPTLAEYSQLGLSGIVIGSFSEMYAHPAASGLSEIRSALASFDPAAPAHAQGYGFQSTAGLRPLWSASRNMVYFLMVVLLIASGFMIMFRVKINPQTAINLQLMIPKIIITLLLVTFSYAIAGLVIDLVYFLVGAGIYMLGPAPGPNIVQNPGQVIDFVGSPGFWKLFLYYIGYWLLYSVGGLLTILPAIIGLLILILVLFLLARVWWMMLKTYVMLLIQVVIAPWQIMLGLLPGQGGFSTWFRGFVANASVFVVVPLMFLFSIIIGQPELTLWDLIPINWGAGLGNVLQLIVNWLATGGINSAAITPLPSLPLFDATGTDVKFWISLAILALIPKTADIIKESLKIPPFKYGTAVGEAVTQPVSLVAKTGTAVYKIGKTLTS